jgi:hypothetical protein
MKSLISAGFSLELSVLHKKMNGNIHRNLSDEREFRGFESLKAQKMIPFVGPSG